MLPMPRSDSRTLNEAFAINAPEYAIGALTLWFSALTLIFMVLRWRKKGQKSNGQDIEMGVAGDAGVCQ